MRRVGRGSGFERLDAWLWPSGWNRDVTFVLTGVLCGQAVFWTGLAVWIVVGVVM